MTKADIVNEISKNTGIEKAVVLETVEKFMESVKGSLAKGENGSQYFQKYYDNNSGPQHSGI